MQTMLDHHRRDRRDLDHLMAQRRWILSLQQGAAAAAGVRVVLHHILNSLNRQQLWAGSWMARLATPLAATAFTPLGRLEPRAIARWRFRGVAGTAADPLPQAGQFGSQGGELNAQLIDFLLLSQDERPCSVWPRQPVRLRNASRGCVHHRQILPEMKPGFKLLSTAQQSRSSRPAVATPECVPLILAVARFGIFEGPMNLFP